MGLLRFLVIVVIGYIVIRMIRLFGTIKRGADHDARTEEGSSTSARPPDDFLGTDIKDAEFEDLTPPPDAPEPPKQP
jgi:hypothetical protein